MLLFFWYTRPTPGCSVWLSTPTRGCQSTIKRWLSPTEERRGLKLLLTSSPSLTMPTSTCCQVHYLLWPPSGLRIHFGFIGYFTNIFNSSRWQTEKTSQSSSRKSHGYQKIFLAFKNEKSRSKPLHVSSSQRRIRCWKDCQHQACHPVLCQHRCCPQWEERRCCWEEGLFYKNQTKSSEYRITKISIVWEI